MLKALFTYSFLQNAMLGAILASIACGIIGTIVIEKKLVMLSGGIAHTAFGGVGLGYFLKIEPIIGALFFAVASALGIAVIHRKVKTQTDILIGLYRLYSRISTGYDFVPVWQYFNHSPVRPLGHVSLGRHHPGQCFLFVSAT
jgi:ABC-type Mn2+/Zn2+ transport system permease subunit